MFKRIWHNLVKGHDWKLAGQTRCDPNGSLLKWQASQYTSSDANAIAQNNRTIQKYAYGWSECILICSCGLIKQVEIVGIQTHAKAS